MSNHEAYLRNALVKYQYADIAKRDILNAFQTFSDLRPTLDTFVFNDGTRKELISLGGTIPVTYKGNTYNIPICMWLMESHPYNPPMVFVRPTSTMQIKQGRHVDANGKIYLPYLHDWKHPQSDLIGLIQILQVIFGQETPVVAVRTPPPRPPYPGSQPQSNLPYPQTGSGMPMPSAGGSSYPTPPYPQAGGGTSYPSYPNYSQSSQSSYQQSSYPNQYTNAQAGTGASTTLSSQGSLSEEQIRTSVLSAVEDKMRRRLREIFAQSQAEMEALKRTQDDLSKGKNNLDDMLSRLEREQNDVERNIMILKEKNDEIKDLLSKMESQEKVDIEDSVVATAPLYKQLLNSFAEEQATEDAIYYLSEGLKRGVIDLETYLKQVRELSRKQFMLRALIQRCRQKAGLPEVASS